MYQKNSAALSSLSSASYKTMLLTALWLAAFFLAFMVQALNLSLAVIGKEFGANAVLLNWMVLAYVLAVAAFSVPFGRIADIVGIKKVIITGMAIYVVSSTAALFSFSSLMLIVCRAVQGMSAAMIMANLPALITVVCTAEERGQAFGINITGVYLGSSIGPFLGGFLTEHFGWRSIFLINIPVVLCIIGLFLWKVKGEWSGSKGQKVDYLGSGLFALTLVILMYGFSLLPGTTGIPLIFLGIIGIVVFIRLESHIQSPVFNINIFKINKTFIFSNLAALTNYMAVFAVAFLLSLYLQYIKGFSPGQAGLIMITHPIVQTILSPVAGRVSDKIEPRFVATLGMATTSIALFIFIFLNTQTPVWLIIIALFILGTGFAFFLSPNTNALMSSVAPKFYGVTSATMSTMISLGQTLSMGITMVVMAIVVGKAAIIPEYYSAFLTSAKIAFGLFTLICIGGIFISLFRGKVKYQQ
jgi:MFS family permease